MICGIDEAGRGSVLGPLVVACVCFKSESEIPKGVKDSKLLTKKERENLAEMIKNKGSFNTIIISPEDIDGRFNNGKNLNDLEVSAMKSLIEKMKPARFFIDSPYKNCEKLKAELKLNKNDVVEHKADLNYPVVSSASIIAKVQRDKAIENLEKKYKVKIGSGYPSDPHTIDFLKKSKEFPFIRKTWETYKNIVKEKEQRQISKWL